MTSQAMVVHAFRGQHGLQIEFQDYTEARATQRYPVVSKIRKGKKI